MSVKTKIVSSKDYNNKSTDFTLRSRLSLEGIVIHNPDDDWGLIPHYAVGTNSRESASKQRRMRQRKNVWHAKSRKPLRYVSVMRCHCRTILKEMGILG